MNSNPDKPAAMPGHAGGENERRILKRDPVPHLFKPLQIRGVTAKNRIMLSLMCQYSGEDGEPNLWHIQNLCARAAGGVGIVCTEAIHTEPRGRITKHCLGLWNDQQRDKLAPVAEFIESQGAVPAIQIGHAGRKGSISRPWEGSRALTADQGAWELISASAIPFADSFTTPRQMDEDDIAAVLESFAQATRRAKEAGFKFLELHAAHGYLAHVFLSPLSNSRNDSWGGDLAGRARFLLETVRVMRGEWPDDLPLCVRLSCTEWVDGGLTLEDILEVCRMLEETGAVDLVTCSSGGNATGQQIPIHPGYQVPFAERVRRETGLKTVAVGMIHGPEQADEIIANGRADIVALGRTLLADPIWPRRAAKYLRAEDVGWPVQYERSDIFG
jgi:2,4-dienoyl-CoA reductase-like NADH-dependent reductase (Old Yellow Enzyme family)